MDSFTKFMKEKEDIQKTLKKLPKSYQNLIKGFEIEFQSGSTLKNDPKHVGMITTHPKKIKLASPWRYSRCFVLLHELAHLIWPTLSPELKKQWKNIVLKNKNRKKDEPDEENFAHSFAATYCDHPPTTHYCPEWVKFIKNLPS